MPAGSAVGSLIKLEQDNIFQWKNSLKGYLGACRLVHYVNYHVLPPDNASMLAQHEMYRWQAMFAITTTCNEANQSHIADINDPRDAFIALEKRNGMSSGLATANVISKIIKARIDESAPIDSYVSEIQNLHSQLFDLTMNSRNFRMSDELLGLFMLINLPREKYGAMNQQLLGDIDHISTTVVLSRLLTESQMQKSSDHLESDSSLALAVTQSHSPERKKSLRVEPSSRDPNAKCFLPGHANLDHTNAECIAQRPAPPKSSIQPVGRRLR